MAVKLVDLHHMDLRPSMYRAIRLRIKLEVLTFKYRHLVRKEVREEKNA